MTAGRTRCFYKFVWVATCTEDTENKKLVTLNIMVVKMFKLLLLAEICTHTSSF